MPFLREVACVAPNGQQYAGPAATARHCEDFARFGPLKATAYAHHPVHEEGRADGAGRRTGDEITIANIGSLGTVLDAVSAQSGGKIPPGLPILLTEFGYESNPPDTRNGIPLLRQAQFNQLAEFLAYADPRVTATTQFLLRDAPPLQAVPNAKGSRLYWFTYQSGLLDARSRAKPAAFAYTFPFVSSNRGAPGMTNFWGQLRFRPNWVSRNRQVRGSGAAPDTRSSSGGRPTTRSRAARTGGPAGPAGHDELPRVLQRDVPDAGAGRPVLRAVPDPPKGKITNRSLTTKP